MVKIKLSRTDIYIPKWNKNRKLPEEEQIKIEYRFMTSEEEERFSLIRPTYSMDKQNTDADGKPKEIAVDFELHANEIWDICVKKVTGLFDESGVEIAEPKKIRAIPGIYGLITEVVAEIKRGLTEEEIKN